MAPCVRSIMHKAKEAVPINYVSSSERVLSVAALVLLALFLALSLELAVHSERSLHAWRSDESFPDVRLPCLFCRITSPVIAVAVTETTLRGTAVAPVWSMATAPAFLLLPLSQGTGRRLQQKKTSAGVGKERDS